MNRRDFLRYLCGTSVAAALVPSGLILPQKVITLPQRWKRHDGTPSLSLIDKDGQVAASQLLHDVTVIESNGRSELHADHVTFTGDMFDEPEKGILITSAIVSIPLGGGAYLDRALPGIAETLTNGGDITVIPSKHGWLTVS